MRIVVTGVAGFIGSTTAQLLLSDGHQVAGIDSMSNYYEPSRKSQNLAPLLAHENFDFHPLDLVADLTDVAFSDADAVVHLAGQPGVRRSWSEFDTYVSANVEGTKAVLDAAVRHGIDRVAYASSSSVYGQAARHPTPEDHPTAPQSPYAVTKLAGEHLCGLYFTERNLHTVSLRYFTAYGPRQRPDMLTQRLVESARSGNAVTIFGDGHQVRDFTFVGDIARANALAITQDVAPGSVYNISGGSAVSVLDMISAVERAADAEIAIEHRSKVSGDVRVTAGDNTRAARELAWVPEVGLDAGVRSHVDWHDSNERSARHASTERQLATLPISVDPTQTGAPFREVPSETTSASRVPAP